MKFYSRQFVTFILFLLCPFVVNGSLSLYHRTNGPPHQASDFEIQQLEYYMTLAGNSYCENVIPRREWNCGNCGKTANMEIVQVFVTPKYDTNAMVVRDDNLKRIIAVFRGSKTQKNFDADSDLAMVDYRGPGIRVHNGFLKSYQEVADQIVPVVQEQVRRYPGYTVAASGHSLGGTLATLHGLDLHERGFQVSIYSYASPRMGNRGFAGYIIDSGIPYHRITSRRDTYVNCPVQLLGYLGFMHAGEESWIQDTEETSVLVCPNGFETDDCYNSDNGPRNSENHYDYFDLRNNIDCLYQDTLILGSAICSANQLLELQFLS